MQPREVRDAFRESVFFERVDPELVEQLASHVTEIRLDSDELLFREGDEADALYVVVEGRLEAVTEPGETDGRVLGSIREGEPVGELAVLLGGCRSATVYARADCRLARLDAEDMAPFLQDSPEMQAALRDQVDARIRRNELDHILHRYFGDLDETSQEQLAEQLEWISVEPGEILFRRGDPGDSLYFVVSGGLWAVGRDQEGMDVPIAELNTGEVVGEMGLISGSERSAGVVAARPSTLVRLSSTTFEALSREHPGLMLGITRQLVDRVRRTQRKRTAAQGGCRRIAVIGATEDPVLKESLDGLRRVLGEQSAMVSAADIDQRWGRRDVAQGRPGDPAHLGVGVFLDELAAGHEIVFHLTDPVAAEGPTPWSRRCLALADEILVVGRDNDDPRPGGLEQCLYETPHELTGRGAAPVSRLLLVHDSDTVTPGLTRQWLEHRGVESHYHLRRGDASSLERVARLISHRAVGIALGGVGLQGLGQVGALRALEEASVPLDMIAGSGIGAIVGGLYARGLDPEALADIDWRFLDRPRRQARAVQRLFGETDIEDLWRPYLCVSTNLSRQSLRCHRLGPLGPAVLASNATPGFSDPVWIDRELHANGGLMNRLPGDLLDSAARHRVGIDTVTTGPSGGAGQDDAGWLSKVGRWFGLSPGSRFSRNSYLIPALFAGSQRSAARVREELDLSLVLPPLLDIGRAGDARHIIRRGYEETSRHLAEHGLGALVAN